MKQLLFALIEDMREWARGKRWPVRVIVLIYMAYIFIHHLGSAKYSSLFGGLNLGIHEFGHMIFTPLGRFMHFLGGSLFQCMVPLIGMVMFFRQKDYFAIFFAFGWLSTNLFYVATYIDDARRMALPLVSPFGAHAIHDWNYMLGRLGLLSWDHRFAFSLRALAGLSMVVCLLGGGWMIWEMIQSPLEEENGDSMFV